LWAQVDLFIYREPEEAKDRDDEEGVAHEFAQPEYAAPALLSAADAQWGPEGADAAQWEPETAAAIPAAAAPGAEWTGAGIVSMAKLRILREANGFFLIGVYVVQ
jgi:small subunit ribosomal protein SAe